jgi:hypothetical protein
VLANTHQPINSVYFPLSGMISSIVETKSGDMIETGMIGNDEVFGAGQAFDHKISLNKAVVQVPGVVGDGREQIAGGRRDSPVISHIGQVQQSAACMHCTM